MAIIQCKECGNSISDRAECCIYCGCPISENKTQTLAEPLLVMRENQSAAVDVEKQMPKHRKKTTTKARVSKKLIGIFAAIVIVVFAILIFTNSSSEMQSEPTIDYAIELLGTPCEKVLSNDAFSVSSFFDINIAKAKTENVFGIAGEYDIFIFDDQEYIDIVTWQSEEGTKHTDTEIESLVNGMIDTYGNPIDSSDGPYLWQNEKYSMMLDVEDGEISIVITNGE